VADEAIALERAAIPTYCTAIAWAEVYAGVRPGEEPLTEAFFEARGEVLLDGAIGRRAGAYLARYGRSHGVELADALVAAAAVAAGLRLWTQHRKHYPMPDVRFYERTVG
jgi:predicted nucleic acid-binding protein